MSRVSLKACFMAGAFAVVLTPAFAGAQIMGAYSAPNWEIVPGYKAPRTSWGKPEISGNWTNSTLTPVNRPREFGERLNLTKEEETPLLERCRELGLWALDAPEEFGGSNLPAVALMAVNEEIGRTVVPFTFPPDSPNLHMLKAVANEEQRRKYLLDHAEVRKAKPVEQAAK